jgi:hypothetical protein
MDIPPDDTGSTVTTRSRIPTFQSIAEEAEYWDTHDSTEFEGEWEEVPEEIRWVVTRPDGRISFALTQGEFAALGERARQEGMGPGSLALRWVLERLKAS